jgi:hypothetical protein
MTSPYDGVVLPVQAMELLTKFDQDCDVYLEQIVAPLNANEPDNLYHYTNDQGLLGILKNRSLWLTDIFALNDPSELKHGIECACDVLTDAAKEGPPELRYFSDCFNQVFLKDFDQNAPQLATHHIGCFSCAPDDLGQWRAYADNGRGYMLAFDGKVLLDAWKAQMRHQSFHINYTVITQGFGIEAKRMIFLDI